MEDVMVRFSDHCKAFQIYTDASNYYIWANMKQKQLPLAYFSRKLTPTQRRYSTIEQEMLAILEVSKEYRNFLPETSIAIFIDHKNLLVTSNTNYRVFWWKQKIEEFGSNIQCVKGDTNVEADALRKLLTFTEQQDIEAMLNYRQVDSHLHILNKYLLDLILMQKYWENHGANR